MQADKSCCFSCAVHNDDLEELKNLLDSCGLSDSQAWCLGRDLLRKVLTVWPDRVKKFLLEGNAKASSERKSESPLYWNGIPLFHSVEADSVETMKSLLQVNRDVDEPRSHDYLAPLRTAAQLGDTEIGEFLLNRIYRSETTSRCALATNNLQTVKSLLQASVDSNEQSCEASIAFETATQLAKEEISKLLFDPLFFNVTQLYTAAETNNTFSMRALLQLNADVEARSHNDLTPLHIAAQLGNAEAAEILLNYGADTNSVCASALCTLFDAVLREGRKALVEFLLKEIVGIKGKKDGTLLHLAAKRNYRAVVKLLLNNGANVEVRDKNNKNTLCLAVERRNLPLIEQILEACSDLRNDQVDIQSDILEALRRYSFRVDTKDTKDCSLLHYAIRRGYSKIVEHLLNLGIDCNAKSKVKTDSTPLHTAISCNRIEIARLLIKNNANVSAKDRLGRTPLHYVLDIFDAENTSIRDISTLLFISGVRVNEPAADGKTALQIAAIKGNEKVVELLLEHEADVNSIDERMETPLHSSARSGSEKVIEILLDKGAKVDARRNDGATALHLAVRRGRTEPVKLLIEKGAEIGARDRFGATPLHIAMTGNSLAIVEILLNAFDDVDCRDGGGKTALHVAVMYGSIRFVRTLLDHGSDINILCNDGVTPVGYSAARLSLDSEWDVHINSDYYGSDNLARYRRKNRIECFMEIDVIFAEHIAKMTALSRWVNEQNLNAIEYIDYRYQQFYACCADEIESMRRKKIGLSNFSYYDVLTKGMNSLTSYARNKYIVRALEKANHKKMFPRYSAVLRHRFKNGLERAGGLLAASLKSFRSLTAYHIQDSVIVSLFEYLSNADLKNLIKAAPCEESDS